MKIHLNDLVQSHIDNTVPVIQISRDRMHMYPGSAFRDIALNAKQPWRAWASPKPSGSQWFAIHLDAIGIFWTVDYATLTKGCAFVATSGARFYWPHGKPGLAFKILRPLYLNWMLEGALAAEYSQNYLPELAKDPVLLDEYDQHLEDMAQLASKFQIEFI